MFVDNPMTQLIAYNHTDNLFSKRDEHSNRSLTIYKVLTVASWLLVMITNIHFAWNAPDGTQGRSIWGQNKAHKTPFSLNPAIVDVYWTVLLVGQIAYVFHLFTGPHITAAANVGSHFIVNNVLMFGFIMCWVYGFTGHFWVAELFLLVNFFNLSSLYFRHSTTPLSIHIPIVSGPLAWNYVALFWCGAAMFGAKHLASRIIANIALLGWLGYGLFFLAAFKDYTMGFNLSILAAGRFNLLSNLRYRWISCF